MEEYCYEEKCRYRHWTSGSVPTHRRGADCPEQKSDLRDRLAAELAVCEGATPGPWEAFGGTIGAMTGPGDCGGCSGILSPAHEPACYWSEIAGAGEADAEFIAHARTGYPMALRALQVVMELCEMLSTPTLHDSDRQVGRIEGLREVRRLIKGVYGDE